MTQGGNHPGGSSPGGSTLAAPGGSAAGGGGASGAHGAHGGSAPPEGGGQPAPAAPEGGPPSDGADPMLGQVIDNRYRVLKKLGEGGMGEVYAAEHVHIEKRVAIKLLRSEIVTNEQAVIRFRREAKETSSIGHPNIIAIEDFGTLPEGGIYLAMELLDGQPLNDMLESGVALEPSRLLNILIQTGHGLAAAHQKGIVHRDMKPENVFITSGPDGSDIPKLLDFGIAKVSGADGNNHLTQTGTIFGTPYYMAPEQALGQAVDHRADIYAVGVIMYEVFTGGLPFVGESFMGILTQHITAEPQPAAEAARARGRELPPVIDEIIARAMKKSADERYQSMDELVEALVTAHRQFSGPGMSSYLAAHPAPPSAPMAAAPAPTPPPQQPHAPQTPHPHQPTPHPGGGAAQPPAAPSPSAPVPPQPGAAPTPPPQPAAAPSAPHAAPGEPKKGKGGLIVALSVVVLVAAGGGVGAYAYMGGFDDDDDRVAGAAGDNGDSEEGEGEGGEGEDGEEQAGGDPTEDEDSEPTGTGADPAIQDGEDDDEGRDEEEAEDEEGEDADEVSEDGEDADEASEDGEDAREEDEDSADEEPEVVQILVNSRPQDAVVLHEGESLGETPALIEIPSDEVYELTLRRRGHHPETIRVDGSEDRVGARLSPIRRQPPDDPPEDDPGPGNGGDPDPGDDDECDPQEDPTCMLQ